MSVYFNAVQRTFNLSNGQHLYYNQLTSFTLITKMARETKSELKANEMMIR